MKQTVFFNGTNCFLLMKQTVLDQEKGSHLTVANGIPAPIGSFFYDSGSFYLMNLYMVL